MENIFIHHPFTRAHLFEGRILTPQAAQGMRSPETASRSPVADYGVVGGMSSKMRDYVSAHPTHVASRFSAYETSLTQSLLIVTIQAGHCQSLLLMHLAEPAVRDMLKGSATQGYMQTLFVTPGHASLVHYHAPFFPRDLAPLLAVGNKNQTISTAETRAQLAGAAAELSHRKQPLLCSGMADVDEVTVTCIV